MHSQIRNRKGEHLDVAFHPASKIARMVVLGHGVTADKDRPLLIALAEGLTGHGWPCLRFSFSGNGSSEGRFEDSTISKERADLGEVLATVPQEHRIAYVGHSMGGAVGVLTASAELSIQCLVSLAGMTHAAEFVSREFGDQEPGKGFMWDDKDCPLSQAFVDDLKGIGNTLEAAAEVIQPWLLIHGTEDDVVPPKDSRDAFEAANCQKRMIEIPGAGHMFGDESYGQIVDAIHEWLECHLG